MTDDPDGNVYFIVNKHMISDYDNNIDEWDDNTGQHSSLKRIRKIVMTIDPSPQKPRAFQSMIQAASPTEKNLIL